MSARVIPASVRRELERQESAETALVFLTITQRTLASPIRVVSDPRNFLLDGNEFIGFVFGITILSNDENAPFSQLEIQNVDKRISEALLLINEPPNVKIEVVSGTQFNLEDNPCTEIGGSGTAERIYSAPQLSLVDVEVNSLMISGRLVSWDYTQELWPGMLATQNRLPGLFR